MEREITIDLGRCFKAVMKKFWLVIICAFTAFGLLFALMPSPSTVYYSTASVYGAAFGSYTESMQTVYLLGSYADVAKTDKVASRAAALLGNNEITSDIIRSSITVSTTEDSPIIYFQAASNDPNKSIAIANAMAESFVIEAQSNLGTSNVQILDRASKTSAKTGKSKIFYGLIGFLAGFLISVIVIMIKEIFSDRLYYVSDATLNGDIEILGVIPETKK